MMKTGLLFLMVALMQIAVGQSSKELLRDGLFAEESEGDLKTATEKYEALLKGFRAERKVAAVALYRLAAVKRKQGEEQAALALYEEFGKKFGDVEPQATLVREDYLAISGKEFPIGADGFSEEDKELARIKKLELTSPDLFPNFDWFKNYVDRGQSQVVAYLLEKGADPNFQGVLNKAISNGNLAMVKQLLDAGADPNHENLNGDALRYAISEFHWQIAELLAKHQARIDSANAGILSHESMMKLPRKRIEFIIAQGLDPNHVDNYWDSKNNSSRVEIPLLDAARLGAHNYAELSFSRSSSRSLPVL